MFGCLAFVLNPSQHKGKFEYKSKKHVFIGYSGQSEGYKLLNPMTSKVTVSREVLFHEKKAWKWENTVDSSQISSTLEDDMDHSDDDTLEEVQNTPQLLQGSSSSSIEDSLVNHNVKYKTLQLCMNFITHTHSPLQ